MLIWKQSRKFLFARKHADGVNADGIQSYKIKETKLIFLSRFYKRWQIMKKLKSAAKNKTGTTLRITKQNEQ